MKSLSRQKIQPDWWTKTFAGLVLGTGFSLAIGALVILLASPYLVRGLAAQLGLWVTPWIALAMFFLAYFFPRGWQAILFYGLANLVAYTCLFVVRG